PGTLTTVDAVPPAAMLPKLCVPEAVNTFPRIDAALSAASLALSAASLALSSASPSTGAKSTICDHFESSNETDDVCPSMQRYSAPSCHTPSFAAYFTAGAQSDTALNPKRTLASS